MTNQSLTDPRAEPLQARLAALKERLETDFPPAFPSAPDAEKTIQWIAGNIDKGLCRIFAIHINECVDEEGYKRLVERVCRRISDPQLIAALQETLAVPAQAEFVPLLTKVAFAEVDQILQQAKVLSREENFLHVQCTRAGNEIIVLADRDSRFEWILPAVQKRLRDELSNLHYEPATIETQSLDIDLGHRLRFLDYELHLAKDRHGETHAHYRLVAKSKRRQEKQGRSRSLGRFSLPRFLRPRLNWAVAESGREIVADFYHKANAIQVGWRHLPIALLPVVAFLFGWRSPATWLCFAAIFVCNWRWPLGIVRLVGAWTLRHKLDATLGACALAALVCLYPFATEFYANLSRESGASLMPPGFYLGQYNKGSPWDAELVSYGLYVPPQLRDEEGPFPLIMFLHGYGERTTNRILLAGLPVAIAGHFGANKPNGPFPFIAFFPIDPTGRWRAGSTEVENVMTALDYIITRHRIDPSRVYLTGISAGGNGVWELAQAYPDKWAAVVPVSAFISPDVERVRHLPAWIFHGAKDQMAPVERQRTLVQQLKSAGAEVRYTEIPDQGHFAADDAYNPIELYDWLAGKKKD